MALISTSWLGRAHIFYNSHVGSRQTMLWLYNRTNSWTNWLNYATAKLTWSCHCPLLFHWQKFFFRSVWRLQSSCEESDVGEGSSFCYFLTGIEHLWRGKPRVSVSHSSWVSVLGGIQSLYVLLWSPVQRMPLNHSMQGYLPKKDTCPSPNLI